MPPEPHLTELDAALLALRRLVDVPPGRVTVTHEGRPVELSTVLVVDAVARLRRRGQDADIGRVAGALRVTHSTASRLVDRAVGADMLVRRSSDSDARRTVLTLTAAGEQLQRTAVDHRTARLAALLADWSDQDVATLTELLQRFVDAADRELPLERRTP